MKMILKVLGWGLILYGSLDLIGLYFDRGSYIFGTEVAGWMYESLNNYLLSSITLLVIGIGLVVFNGDIKKQ
jgi:hypothetical protein